MVQTLFFIRFRRQLRRTNPELVRNLEDTVTRAAFAAGGNVEAGHKILTASFNEARIGFWLDMVIFLEEVRAALGKAANDLYGYAFVVGKDIADNSFQPLCQAFSRKDISRGTGVWCSEEVRNALSFFMTFRVREPAEGQGERELPFQEYRELLEFFSFDARPENFPLRKKIGRDIAQGKGKNTLLAGTEQAALKDGVYHYSAGILGDVPPLVVSFGTGGRGLICFADAWNDRIRSFVSAFNPEETINELDALHALLFRERLREEWSPYMTAKSGAFTAALFEAYSRAAKAQDVSGVLVLENIFLADSAALGLLTALCSVPESPVRQRTDGAPGGKPLVLALGSPGGDLSEAVPEGWDRIFPRVVTVGREESASRETAGKPEEAPKEMPRDLWEAAYNISLLGRYFPACLFPRLFEEEGICRNMYFRAVKILSALGAASSEDPLPVIPGFVSLAEKVLQDRTESIRSAVRNRILAWVLTGKLRPCFNLLRILSELGERAGDVLVLNSLRADVLNGTWKGIEEALNEGYFARLAGAENARAAAYIYTTLKTLAEGGREEIERVFGEPVPPMTLEDGRLCYAGFRAQVQANLAAFYTGTRNVEAASEAVRNAMLLNRDLGNDAVPAYRLFALVNLSRQRVDDALEYISFALDQAEKNSQSGERAVTFYYAASINLLYGNLSRAERLAARAEEAAAAFGQPAWEARARFLKGRACFETGRYGDALDIFESLAPSESPGEGEMRDTVRAWIFRTKNCLGRFPQAEENPGADAAVFEIEAACFNSDYKRAETLAENFLSAFDESPRDDFIYTERPDWRSGFSQCEFLYHPEKFPGRRMALIYRALARCSLDPPPEEKAEILDSMQRFARDELLPDTDPNDTLFFHAWYSMLKSSTNTEAPVSSEASQVNMATILSMAYKRLQRRAGRIDDTETKQTFLSMPRWSSVLGLAAKKYKLI